MARSPGPRTAAGHKRIQNRPVERRPAASNEEAARAIVNQLYADVWLAMGRVSAMDDKRRNPQLLVAVPCPTVDGTATATPARCGETTVDMLETALLRAMRKRDCITIYNGVTGELVTQVYENLSFKAMRLSYLALYQQARRSLGLPSGATNISLALVSRFHHAPCQLNAGEIVPAHRGACFTALRGSTLDAILHR